LGAEREASTQVALQKRNGDDLAVNGTVISIIATVPILGWTSGNATTGSVFQNTPALFRAYKNGGSVTANTTIPTWTSTSIDNIGAFDASAGTYTVKIPGSYRISFKAETTSGTPIASIYKNGTEVDKGLNSGVRSNVFAVLPSLIVGDIITVRLDSSLTIASNNISTTLEIEKINDPSTFLILPKIAYLKDVKSNTTQGGTCTSGSFITRTLNTEEDPFNIVTLSSNQFTLQPGTYVVEAEGMTGVVDGSKMRIRNITDSTTAISGINQYSTSSAGVATIGTANGYITLTAQKTFELQHRCATTKATDGLGAALSFSETEVYATVKIQKLY
jgi:hypothetical protein